MKFKGILTEAFIDTLPLQKIEKYILNQMHDDGLYDMEPHKVSEYITKMSKDIAVDLDMVVRMYMTYKKYKGILFSEKGVEVVEEYDTLSKELHDLTRKALYTYLHKNYENKTTLDYEGISGTVHFMEDLEIMINEELQPEIYVDMTVTGEYKYDDGTIEGDTNFFGALYLGMLPTRRTSGEMKIGFDFINFNEEVFGDWMIEVKGRKNSDMVDSGYIKQTFFKPPKNLSENELKRVCDEWIEICNRIIKRNVPLLLEYKDYIERGGIFEGYNKKNKLK